MRGKFALVLLLSLSAAPAVSQQTPPAPTQNPNCPTGLCQVGGRVSPPIPLYQPEAEYTKEARKKKITGICLVGLIVDEYGFSQNVHVVKSLEPGLDKNAIKAVKKYRFQPAMKNKTIPVPVEINIEVYFRLY